MYFRTTKKEVLSVEYFISKRVLKSELQGNKVSRPITRIAIISIALAVVVNLITLAVVTGFQHEIREKVSGFGSHILITNVGENSIYEGEPILKNQSFYPSLKENAAIKNIHYVAYKPVLLQSEKYEKHIKLASGKDSSFSQQEIQGALLKGIDNTYDPAFFKKHLIKGRLPHFTKDTISNEIIVSERVASDLNLQLNKDVRAFFVKNSPIKRMFKLVGIYSTGLEEFDKKIIVGDLRIVQELNDWGVKASVTIADTLLNNQLVIKANISGGNGNYRYDWGKGFENYSGFTLCPNKDTTIRLIVSEYSLKPSLNKLNTDTAYLKIKVKGTADNSCNFNRNQEKLLEKEYLNDSGSKFTLKAPHKTVYFEQIDGKGSCSAFVAGFEVNVKEWHNIPEIVEQLQRKIELFPTKNGESLSVRSIIDDQSDIFIWLGFLDINVVIILTLMILIGIINMGSTLLVIILVRTNFIGILKSIGANDWSIRKIFLIQAGNLILKGLIYGNVIGLLLCALQYFFGVIRLNPEIYYLNRVPIELTFGSWILLNCVTLVVCLSALIIPSIVITKIEPAKAIRFD
jgi:lipoprotein-releasing system permease protein